MELGIIFNNKIFDEKMKIYFFFLGGFLVVVYIVMIFGMVNLLFVFNMLSMLNM